MMTHHSQTDTWCPEALIEEQPKARALRFRYATEGDKSGNLQGANSSPEQQTFPAIRLRNCEGMEVEVYVSCVTASAPHYAHPHRLIGPHCENGIYTVKVSDLKPEAIVRFPKMGIQCCKQKAADISQSLVERPPIACDPFGAGSLDHGNFDLTTVRLCFQCVLRQNTQQWLLPPVLSNPIVDKKVGGDLVICHMSRSSGSVCGGDEVFLLCTSVKKDIEVIFVSDDNSWTAKGEFSPADIHKQIAIVFKTPSFCSQIIAEPVVVGVYLYSPSLQEQSQPKQFTYYPEDPDPYKINLKRKRKSESFANFLTAMKFSCSSSSWDFPASTCGMPGLCQLPRAQVPADGSLRDVGSYVSGSITAPHHSVQPSHVSCTGFRPTFKRPTVARNTATTTMRPNMPVQAIQNRPQMSASNLPNTSAGPVSHNLQPAWPSTSFPSLCTQPNRTEAVFQQSMPNSWSGLVLGHTANDSQYVVNNANTNLCAVSISEPSSSWKLTSSIVDQPAPAAIDSLQFLAGGTVDAAQPLSESTNDENIVRLLSDLFDNPFLDGSF